MWKILSLATLILVGADLFGVVHEILSEFLCFPHPPPLVP